MAKCIINEEKLFEIINESIYEVLTEAQQDEGFGHWLGQTFQGLRNKWNNFKGDFKAGKQKAMYDNLNYDPFAHYGDEGNNYRNLDGHSYATERYNRTVRRNANAPRYERERMTNNNTMPNSSVPQQTAPSQQTMPSQQTAPSQQTKVTFGQTDSNVHNVYARFNKIKNDMSVIAQELNKMGMRPVNDGSGRWVKIANKGQKTPNESNELVAKYNNLKAQLDKLKPQLRENKNKKKIK